MKKLLGAFALLALPQVAVAQETYSLSASAAQVARITTVVSIANEVACLARGLAATCTQAQICTAATAPGGAACTAAQARNANVRIFPLTQAGREEFITFQYVAPRVNESFEGFVDYFRSKYCTWFNAQTAAVQNAECSKTGSPAGCSFCR